MVSALCHIYGQLGQTSDRTGEVLRELAEMGIPADISFDLDAPESILAEVRNWRARGNVVAPSAYPSHLDAKHTNSNWWALEEGECVRLLTILKERAQAKGFDGLDAVDTYTPGNWFIRACRKLGYRFLTGFCAPTLINDGHWQITQIAAPLAPFFASDEDFRKPQARGGEADVLIASMELRNPLDCLEHWSEGPFCPLNLIMGDRTIEAGEEPIESMAAAEDWMRLTELTGQPRFFTVNLQYFTSRKCYDITRRMLQWLKEQQLQGRLRFVGLREYAGQLQENRGVLPQTTYWRGGVVGSHVGGRPGTGTEVVVCENHQVQRIFRQGARGAERYFDYTTIWNYPAFEPLGLLPKSEGYAAVVEQLQTQREGNELRLSFTIRSSRAKDLKVCLWDGLAGLTGPFTVLRVGGAGRCAEVVPHPGGSGGCLLVDVTQSGARVELAVESKGTTSNRHSRTFHGLFKAETVWIRQRPLTRIAADVCHPLRFSIRANTKRQVTYDFICGKKYGSGSLPQGQAVTVELNGQFSQSMFRLWDVSADELEVDDAECQELSERIVRENQRIARTFAASAVPPTEPVRFYREQDWPNWLTQAAKVGADRGIATVNQLVAERYPNQQVVAARHLASDLPFSTKGRVRCHNLHLDRVEQPGREEVVPVFYDYGQSYGPGITGWNMFLFMRFGLRGLDPKRKYTLLLNAYDQIGRAHD